MSTKYKHGDEVPATVLAKRLEELSDAVTQGKAAIDGEFVMRIPAELDHCPDLVMSQASRRLLNLEAKLDRLMLEFCPDEMTQEQIENWGKHQKPVARLGDE